MAPSIRQFLKDNTLTRDAVDRYLDSSAHNWAGFDPELAYVRKNSVPRDGIGGGYALCTHGAHDERRTIHYAGDPCRINSYGDSFTYGDQVNDAETWQEYLAAHLGEPIRNFGVGGYGVYQAYRRMLREEAADLAAEHILFGIYDDDHMRSICPWWALHMSSHFWPGVRTSVDSRECFELHATPWAHLQFNPDSGVFEEHENAFDTPESLYTLCDEDFVYETFSRNFDVQTNLAMQQASDVDPGILNAFAAALDVPLDLSTPERMQDSARQLLTTCSLRSTLYVLDKLVDFAEEKGKRFMIVLTYNMGAVSKACSGQPRFDQVLIDHLQAGNYRYIDMLTEHENDFKSFTCSPDAYVERYFYGHYAPQGNHFLAFTLRRPLKEWLDPPPPTYRDGGDIVKAHAGIIDGRRSEA